ncbi:MAG: hypothetical protein A2857_01130 [Candidatus Levybacteria bacterium RIFCSPHIGHO2_01_FULL_36_15]|nr:MAG: hypothetical protein A2857_01130 [Candidatus Levybacteria bacterium RIFCSPHIGHO2_01_FULL_36_15]
MKIVIATHNPAKFKRYKRLLKDLLGIEFISLENLGIIDRISEPFDNAKENAIFKAKEYAKLTGYSTLAVDEQMKTNFLPREKQPGVFVRRIKKNSQEATDEEVLKYWEKIFYKYPQENKKFIWDFYIVLYNPATNKSYYWKVIQIATAAKKFSNILEPGYPMSSFLIHSQTNKPYSELSEDEKLNVDKKIFHKFVRDFKNLISI